MPKLLQNRIAESGMLLPAAALIALAVWLLCGLIDRGWWGQLICFAVSAYLMVELSNGNALLRVRSRMVSSVFLILSCTFCFNFGSLSAGIVQLCSVAAIIILFHSYQDDQAPGWTFYAFLCLGLGSMAFIQLLIFAPIAWLLMAVYLQSLSLRTWVASLIGLVTPYWFAGVYLLFERDFSPVVGHFEQLGLLALPPDYSTLTMAQVAALAFITVLTLTGIVHFWLRSFEDKHRIRQLYGVFTTVSMLLMVCIVAQPQYYDQLARILVVSASPIVAHFFTHTHSRATNICFAVVLVLAALLTGYNLLSPLISSWIGS